MEDTDDRARRETVVLENPTNSDLDFAKQLNKWSLIVLSLAGLISIIAGIYFSSVDPSSGQNSIVLKLSNSTLTISRGIATMLISVPLFIGAGIVWIRRPR